MGYKKTLPVLIDMLVNATVAGDRDTVHLVRQALDYRMDQLYWLSPREVHARVGLEPGHSYIARREDVADLYAAA